MLRLSVVAVFANLLLLAGCGGGGGGTPSGVPITISLSATLNSVNPGQATTITATVSNDTSNKGVSWSLSPSGGGALSKQTTTSVVYTAPANVPTATAVTITATSLSSSSVTANIQISVQSSAISISLSPAAPQTLNQGQQLAINAVLTNDTGNKGVTWSWTGVGSLSNKTSTSATYVAPNSVASNSAVTVTATSVADSNAAATLEITVFPSGAGPNVAVLNVNSGPAGTVNLAFVSLTICEPGTTICQTVDNIQVDTGSEGLRLLQSSIPVLSLPVLTDSTGNTINNCVQFLDTSYLWGPVEQADVKVSGEVASQTLVQVVSSSNAGIPSACTNGGTVNENTPALLGANGILGVGPEPTDCVLQGSDFCDGSISSPAPAYFSCPNSGCSSTDSPIAVDVSNQVANPVVLFGTDDNGVLIKFPALAGAASSVSGSLIFGVQTQSNNDLGTATLFDMDANDNFVTMYNGQTLTASFIDSGSNALFFPSSIAVCADDNNFYCPPSLTAQSATNQGATVGSSIVNFSIDNADSLLGNLSDTAFSTLGGPQGTANTCSNGNGSCTFDWGVPFFYGRGVFTAIDGQVVSGVGSGPFWAY